MRRSQQGLARSVAVAWAAGVLLAGCGGIDSGVELNGKIFDVMGVGSNSAKQSDAKLEPRAPLVPPPNTAALPVPGQTADQHMAWPSDPDLKKRQATLSLDQKRRQECNEQNKFGSASDKQANHDPNRSCGTILDWMSPTARTPDRPTDQAVKQMPR